jgi:phosphoribosylformylglycinamidine synthase subunit PurQ / glutaminase
MRIGVVIFPGSNGDHDALAAVEFGLQQEAVPLWHKYRSVDGCDALFIPGGFSYGDYLRAGMIGENGGFSYGDYLRAGAIARFSPIMPAVAEFAAQGGPVLGICNGFQILTEAHLLPGALLRNRELTFSCRWVHVRVESEHTAFTAGLAPGTVLRLPIAHGEGCYFVTPEQLEELEEHRQIIFRYTDALGEEDEAANPNGSTAHIAGVSNRRGNVVGLMPHPERAYDPTIGGTDGLHILGAMLQSRRQAQTHDALVTANL